MLSVFLAVGCSLDKNISLSSPDGQITLQVQYESDNGTLIFDVQSRGSKVIGQGRTGLVTDYADFTSGTKLKSFRLSEIDETWAIPQGKVSQYRNQANVLEVTLKKEGKEMVVEFRVYDDGFAFRYMIPGEGKIVLHDEHTAFTLAGENCVFWGQKHPNRYGYESALDKVDANLISTPVLAFIKENNHFVLAGQAGTRGNYIQPHFERNGSTLSYRFPLDQEKIGPVKSGLPFSSPWRMIVISAGNPGKIVETYMPENLNPPTRQELKSQDGTLAEWIKPGRVMWDYIAKDGDKPRMWIDATAEMGWEYYMADAGFVNRWGGPDSVEAVISYAAKKNVGVIGWAHTREFNTPEKAAETMGKYSGWGLKGAKIDFFDHNTLSENPKEWRDYEDTQQSLQMRDWILEEGIKHSMLLELHGNTMPSGERREFPNLMTLEGVDGMERKTKPAANDLTIPFVRNVMGPVSYTIIHFERSPGTHAYQMAMAVIYEAGLKIYAEHGKKLLGWPGRELISQIPAEWDESRFIEGFPGSYITMARRHGKVWYVAGMTSGSRSSEICLDFLERNIPYKALIFSDQSHDHMNREVRVVKTGDCIHVDLLERGGFTIQIVPEIP